MKLSKLLVLATAAIFAITLTACNGGGGNTSEAVELTLYPDGNQMLFEQETLTVEAGQEVRLIFDNTATAPSMAHNVVLLNTGDSDEADRVGNLAFEAGPANEYVPDDPAVLAYTPVAQIGETVEMTFTAPSEPGEYIYFCTYPGHHPMMRGVLIVE